MRKREKVKVKEKEKKSKRKVKKRKNKKENFQKLIYFIYLKIYKIYNQKGFNFFVFKSNIFFEF